MKKKKILNTAIVGASGIIGQVFVHLLNNHPFFRIESLIASEKRVGKKFGDVINRVLPFNTDPDTERIILEDLNIKNLKSKGIKYVFSALPASAGLEIEAYLRDNGFFVFSNSAAFRKDRDVPILIPDVNGENLELIKNQGFPEKGFIVTNPNCSTAGLAVALHPLKDFGIKEITISTYQAISGAGYPGIPSLDIHDNVIPYIDGEEEKIEFEINKILEQNANIFATCVRVPVRFGHLETVWIKFEHVPEFEQILEKWECQTSEVSLPSVPKKPVVYVKDGSSLKNNLSFTGSPQGMVVFTGGLKIKNGKVGFNLLVNNVVRGGAGGSIANAEFFNQVYGGRYE